MPQRMTGGCIGNGIRHLCAVLGLTDKRHEVFTAESCFSHITPQQSFPMKTGNHLLYCKKACLHSPCMVIDCAGKRVKATLASPALEQEIKRKTGRSYNAICRTRRLCNDIAEEQRFRIKNAVLLIIIPQRVKLGDIG